MIENDLKYIRKKNMQSKKFLGNHLGLINTIVVDLVYYGVLYKATVI